VSACSDMCGEFIGACRPCILSGDCPVRHPSQERILLRESRKAQKEWKKNSGVKEVQVALDRMSKVYGTVPSELMALRFLRGAVTKMKYLTAISGEDNMSSKELAAVGTFFKGVKKALSSALEEIGEVPEVSASPATSGDGDVEDYAKMEKQELKNLCKGWGLSGYKSLERAELVDLLREAQESQDEEEEDEEFEEEDEDSEEEDESLEEEDEDEEEDEESEDGDEEEDDEGEEDDEEGDEIDVGTRVVFVGENDEEVEGVITELTDDSIDVTDDEGNVWSLEEDEILGIVTEDAEDEEEEEEEDSDEEESEEDEEEDEEEEEEGDDAEDRLESDKAMVEETINEAEEENPFEISDLQEELQQYARGGVEDDESLEKLGKSKSKNVLLRDYKAMLVNFVDDDGDISDFGEKYTRLGEEYCCGWPTNGEPCKVCEVDEEEEEEKPVKKAPAKKAASKKAPAKKAAKKEAAKKATSRKK